MAETDKLPSLPFDQAHPLAIPPLLQELQAHRPISRVRTPAGDEAWLVTRHADICRLLVDERLGMTHRDPANAPKITDSMIYGRALGNFETEHADQARMRRLWQPFFTSRRMRALRPWVEKLTDRLLDDLARRTPPADLHDALSLPLPVLVICELIGIPYEDREQFRTWTDEVAFMHDRERSKAALGSLFAYMAELVARKHRQPGDDVISGLCATEGVDDDEIAIMASVQLFAGYETTAGRIDMGILQLLANPDQWRALRDDPSSTSAAVEEILRTSMTGGRGGGGVPRWAREDIDIGGVTIHAGDAVLLDLGAANHDDRVFGCPESFDIARAPDQHLTFGHGYRYCIGAPLARIELQTVFGRLPRLFPEMRLAVPLEEISVLGDQLAAGISELPVVW